MKTLKGRKALLHGPCEEVLKEIPDNSADFLLTDPPFNVKLDYNEYNDDLPDEVYSDWCRLWVDQCYRILKPAHYGVIFTGDKKLYFLHKAIMESEFTYHHMLKWQKPSCQRALSGTVFFYQTELAFVISKGKPNTKLINRKEMWSDTLVAVNLTPKSKEAKGIIHHAQRPVALYQQIIRGFTKPGDTVLEPFAGSGSVPVAAVRCDRVFVAAEIDKFYIDMTQDRVEEEFKRPPQYGAKPVIVDKNEGPHVVAKKLFIKEVVDD